MYTLFGLLFVVALVAFIIAIKNHTLFHRKNLKPSQKHILSVIGAAAVIAMVGSSLTEPSQAASSSGQKPPVTVKSAPAKTTSSDDRNTRIETEDVEIAFNTRDIDDATLPQGKTVERQAGMTGTRTTTFSVTYVDGKETGRKKIKEEVVTPAVDKIVAHGTYVQPAAKTTPDQTAPDGACNPDDSSCVPSTGSDDCTDDDTTCNQE